VIISCSLATEVTLNGQLLGETENMFRRYEWEVKALLRESDSKLETFFSSPVQHVTARIAERPLIGLRTIELRQEPDEWGKSLTFVVNRETEVSDA
jgi:beta-galactosidase/beta-glucuronidase